MQEQEQEQGRGTGTAEKIAGVIAVIAALIVLNGAWVNQHNWQNVSWRIAVSALLVALAVFVETNAFGFVVSRERRDDEPALPDFMRNGAGSPTTDASSRSETAQSEAVSAERRR